jgi:hypothetical protein
MQAARLVYVVYLSLAGLAVLAPIPEPLRSQEVVLVPDGETYCRCDLTLEPVVTLGAEDGWGTLLGEVRQVRRDSRGVYHVLAYQEYQIYRFDPDGEALAPLGRQGQGPGEALLVSTFEIAADSVFAFDRHMARMTVYDPDGKPVRTMPIKGSVHDVTHVSGRGLVLNARISEASTFGIPLHVIDDVGTVSRSFGGDGMIRIDAPALWQRSVAADGDDVWAAFENQYVIERWSLDGTLEHTVERTTDWFEPHLLRSWGGPDEPIDSWVTDMIVDERGYIRTTVLRASPHWPERLPPPRLNIVGDPIYPVPAGTGLFEAVIEVIDPEGGRLFVTGVFDTEVYGFVDAEHVWSYHEPIDGVPSVSIWRLRLSTPLPPSSRELTAR